MFFQTHKGSLQVFRYCSIFKVLCASALRLTTCLLYHRSGFLSSLIFLEAFELSELGPLQISQYQLVFSASIGSFQGLPAVASEVILLPQRLALKYNTTPPPPCQHFLTDFFIFFAFTPKQQQTAGKTAPQLHCSCGGKSGRVLSRKYSGFQDLRRVSQTAAASMGSIPIRPMGAGPNTL